MKNKKRKYSESKFFNKIFKFIYIIISDIKDSIKTKDKVFKEFGLTMFCGRQGGGKTTAMVEYLERMRHKYPDCIILTNFGYKNETQPFIDWQDFFNVRNDDRGVIFAIDEIQNEFNSSAWRDFPEQLLSEITQQRKQKIKIVATSQVYNRVAKPLREQCFEVVECRTIAGRWTWCRAFDAYEYNSVVDFPERKDKLRRLWRLNFIQDKELRDLYDSYAKIERIKRQTFVDRDKRI